MRNWTIFDSYGKYKTQEKEGTFSPITKKTAYDAYQSQVSARYKNHNLPLSDTRSEAAQPQASETASAFYVRASQIRDKVLFDYELLASLIEDKPIFNRLTSDERKQIEFYYAEYATLLLDDASVSHNDTDAAAYQNSYTTYAAKYNVQRSTFLPQPEATDEPTPSQSLAWLNKLNTQFKQWRKEVKKWVPISPQMAIFWFGFLNIYRLLFTFFRLTWQSLLTFGRAVSWMDTSPLVDSVPIFNILSVMLFLGRFVVDFTMVLVHTFFPTEAEKGVNFIERFQIECRKRYRRMVNDVAWSLFNSFTNFAWAFGIPLVVAGPLLVCFLAFDIYWYGHKWYQDELAISEEKAFLNHKIANGFNSSDIEIKFARLKLRQLMCRREKVRADYIFSLVAAGLLVLSFVFFLTFSTSPVAAPICFFACAFAVAMYINSGGFSKACQTSYERSLSDAQTGKQCLDETEYGLTFVSSEDRQAYQQSRLKAEREAWNTFYGNFAKAIIVPAVIIGIFTVCWPAALALTVAYLLYEAGCFKPIKDKVLSLFAKEKVSEGNAAEGNPLLPKELVVTTG